MGARRRRLGKPPLHLTDRCGDARGGEADEFYTATLRGTSPDRAAVARQAFAGLLWSKQFYEYVVPVWLAGDPAQPPPPPERARHRNAHWSHLHCRDVLPMPDK